MNGFWARIVSGLLLLLVVGCASQKRITEPVDPVERLDVAGRIELAGETALVTPLEERGATVTAVVMSPDGKVLWSHDSERLMVPASVQKLCVSADAMLHLGSDSRWTTELTGVGEMRSDTLVGDLMLVGSWDPTLSGDPCSNWPWEAFDRFAADVKAQGVAHVTGSVRVVGRMFVPGWWEAGDFGEYYAPAIGQVMWNDGLLTSFAGALGDSVQWEIWPPRSCWTAEHDRPRAVRHHGDVGPVARFHGSAGVSQFWQPIDDPLWPGLGLVTYLPAVDPRHMAGDALRHSLAKAGVSGAESVVVELPENGRKLQKAFSLKRESVPLDSVLATLLATSCNAWAEEVEATVMERNGFVPGKKPCWPAALDSLDVPRRNLRAVDGCGMARHNNLSAATVADLLAAGWERWGSRWVYLLPTGGDHRSTLDHRLRGVNGRIRVKTGSMSRISSLAGYVLEGDEPAMIFVVFVNNAPADPANRIDDFVRELVRITDQFAGKIG